MENCQDEIAKFAKQYNVPNLQIVKKEEAQKAVSVSIHESFYYMQIMNDTKYSSQVIKAEDIFRETKDIEAVNDYCHSVLMSQKANKLLQESKISERFLDATFDTFEPNDTVTHQAKVKAEDYAKKIRDYRKTGTNLIIEGRGCVGTGKTHLANAIAHYLMSVKCIPCKFINVTSMIARMKENFNTKEYTDIEVLVIDDLGKEKGTDWVCEQIYTIINTRYELKKPTVITTENSISDLKTNYGSKGKAIVSRLTQDFILIALTGKDKRPGRNK